MILHSTVLENGLRVYVHTVPGVRTVTFSIWIDQGSKDEDTAINGLSHLVEHLAFDLSADGAEGARLWGELQAVGARCNATTTKEFTYYYITLLPEYAELACRTLRQMLVRRNLSPESLDRERQVVLEEMSMQLSSTDQIYDRFAQSLWGDRSLGQMVIGRKEVIADTSFDTVSEFVARGYRADRAGLVVVGDIDHQRVMEMADRYFGDWDDSTTYAPPVEVGVENSIFVIQNQSDHVTLALGASSYAYDNPRRAHVELLVKLLGAGPNSRLHQAIRHKRGLAYYVSAYTQSYKPAGLVAAIVKCSHKNVQEVIKLILHEFARLRSEPVLEQELNQAKELLRTDKYLEVEHSAQRMRLIGRSAMLGESFSVNSYLRLIRTIDSHQIQETARDLFRRRGLAVAAIGAVNEEELLVPLTGRIL